MSYAIIRNAKLTRAKSIGAYTHNERKAEKHSNKNIDKTRTPLNYYLKKNKSTYIKEFDRLKEETNIQGQIRSNSNILCELMITSDAQFFEEIGLKETKRYFQESYDFICNYKNLGEQNIVGAVVHLDEGAPHLHLVFTPVIRTKDKEGNIINKLSCRDFWKGQTSYRELQDKFHAYVTAKGFKLERGKAVEETNREHYTVAEYKNITNFENTEKLLDSITLDLPPVPELKRTDLLKTDKAIKKAIEPRDNLIKELHQDKVKLHKELSKQVKLIEIADKFDDERDILLSEKRELNSKYNELQQNFKYEKQDLENMYEGKIHKLEKQVKFLENLIDRFKVTIKKFIKWICKKFEIPSEDDLICKFERETYTTFNVDKQLDYTQFKKQKNIER